MPRFAHRFVSTVLLLLCLSSIIPCQALAPELSASAYVLMEADSGRVLLAGNETQELPIASTTKIMTALVALRHSRLTDVVTVKKEHLREGSSMYLAEGETLTMEELLYGLMLPSGNDAAECIADYCGGGTERFVAWMNEEAAALGLEHTAFANPSGLDQEGHYSCAIDMARLMAYAMRDPAFARIASTANASVGTRTMSNHNKLLGTLQGCIGGKTGYTGSAGRTLVTCAERDGMRLIAVTLHDRNDWQDHASLYEYGFSTYRSVCVLARGNTCAICAVRGGESAYVELIAQKSVFYPAAANEKLTIRIEAPESAQAPLRAGMPLGEAVILLDGAEVARAALAVATDVKQTQVQETPRGVLRIFHG